MKYILKLLGYEINQPTRLYYSMMTFTNESWLDGIVRRKQLYRYLANK